MKAETSLLPLKLTQNNNNNYYYYMMNVYSGTCSQNFSALLCKSQKLHATECNSSQRGEIRFEGLRPISLLVVQNNCWLVPESNLEQKIQSSTISIEVLHTCKMKSKKKIVVLKSKKSFLFEKIDKNIQFNYLFLVNS